MCSSPDNSVHKPRKGLLQGFEWKRGRMTPLRVRGRHRETCFWFRNPGPTLSQRAVLPGATANELGCAQACHGKRLRFGFRRLTGNSHPS